MSALPSAMRVRRAGEDVAPSPEGVATGRFVVETLLSSRIDGELTAMRAEVGPGVITHWHSHPRGQLLVVLDGVGLAQSEGGEIVELRAGDSVWFAPGERHWHGAASGLFSYLSVQQTQDGAAVRWGEPVNPEETRP
jgi:quercetin dioxygenase-like cupin family protein